jgi:hypothetical protein
MKSVEKYKILVWKYTSMVIILHNVEVVVRCTLASVDTLRISIIRVFAKPVSSEGLWNKFISKKDQLRYPIHI